MSTGKRLAKRSIIGTRVCAPGADGLYHSGVIQTVRTPASSHENNNCINLTPHTKYFVRFDSMSRRGQNREFRESDLIGPGFRSILDVSLKSGQKVFLTYNGRETSGQVVTHDVTQEEVNVLITPMGQEAPLELKKRIEEVRLLESRRSARLADQERDTDFARLADMAGDRRRASHSIDVPLTFTQHGSRKRRPSYSQDDRDMIYNDDVRMDECNAALVLMSLSCSPHSPHAVVGQWATVYSSSPGSSSASWSSSSGSSSPPLSEEGVPNTAAGLVNNARFRTTSLSTSDEGIVMDYNEEMPRKKRANGSHFRCTWKGCGVIFTTVSQIEAHIRNIHLGPKKPRQSLDDDGTFSDSDHEEEFYYTEIEDEEDAPSPASPPTLSHRDMARPPHEDPEYQRQIVGNFRQGLLSLTQTTVRPPLPITAGPINIPSVPLAHHNYTWSQQSPTSPQKHVRLSPRPSTSYAPYPSPTYSNAIAAAQHNINTYLGTPSAAATSSSAPAAMSMTAAMPPAPLGVATSVITNGPSAVAAAAAAVQNLAHSAPPTVTVSNHRPSPLSPNRRTRGENKKCRKVYGMEHKDQWCTQCKWKKACSRFGD